MFGNYEGDKISHYRIDRIVNIEILKEKRKNISKVLGSSREFNVAEYMSKLVGMSSGHEEHVIIRFKNENIEEVIDYLGYKVDVKKDDCEHFTLRERVIINKKFTKWIITITI